MSQYDAEFITAILKSRYHENLTIPDVRKKHGISQKVWSEINKKFGEMFIKKYGKRETEKINISVGELHSYWARDDRDEDPYRYR